MAAHFKIIFLMLIWGGLFANEPTLDWLNKMSSGGVCCSEKQIQTTKVDIPSNYGVDEAKITGITFSSYSKSFKKIGVPAQGNNGKKAFFHSVLNRDLTIRTREYIKGKAPHDIYREGVFPKGVARLKSGGNKFLYFTHKIIERSGKDIGVSIVTTKKGFVRFKIKDKLGAIGSEFKIELTKNDTVAKLIVNSWRGTNSKYTSKQVMSKIRWFVSGKRNLCIRVKNVKNAIDGNYCIKYLLNRGNKLNRL